MQVEQANRSTSTFDRIYDDTFEELKKYVAAKCSDPCYVSDILQETYFELYKLLEQKGDDYAADIRAVLFKIAKRRVYRYYSLKQRLSVFIPLFVKNEKGDEYCAADEAEIDDVADTVINEAEAERLWKIIQTYPADVRKIMYLYFNCGMSHAQIATALGCTLSNVKNKLYRTLAEIRRKENGDE